MHAAAAAMSSNRSTVSSYLAEHLQSIDEDEQVICALCRKGSEPLSGGALPDDVNDFSGPWSLYNGERNDIEHVYVHRQCALWSPRCFVDSKSGEMQNVALEVSRARALFCDVCRKSGAAIGCLEARCRRSFHLACAEQALCFIDRQNYRLLCGECGSVDLFKRYFSDVDPDSLLLATSTQLYEMAKKHIDRKVAADQEQVNETSGEIGNSSISNALSGSLDASASTAPAPADLSAVCGLDDVVTTLKEAVLLPLVYPALLKRLHVRPSRGILLHGPPGTGKTMLARALAGTCSRMNVTAGAPKVTFFARKGADVLCKFYGESERKLRELFADAKAKAPSVIFFDEIDGLAPPRSPRQNQVHSSIVCTLLSLMDGIDSLDRVFVLGATNRVDAVDPALRRPGRFDRDIFVPLPSLDARKQMLRLYARMLPEPDVDVVARRAHGFSGSHMRHLCAEAVLLAVREMSTSTSTPTPASLNLRHLRVGVTHFLSAIAWRMRPLASRHRMRAQPLPEPVAPLLSAYVDRALHLLGVGAAHQQDALSPSPPPFEYAFSRKFLIEGERGAGQRHVLSAVLHLLDRSALYSLDLVDLEAPRARSLAAVFRSASFSPRSIVYITALDDWWHNADEQTRAVLLSCVASMPRFVSFLCASNAPLNSSALRELSFPVCAFRQLAPAHARLFVRNNSVHTHDVDALYRCVALVFGGSLSMEIRAQPPLWQRIVHALCASSTSDIECILHRAQLARSRRQSSDTELTAAEAASMLLHEVEFGC